MLAFFFFFYCLPADSSPSVYGISGHQDVRSKGWWGRNREGQNKPGDYMLILTSFCLFLLVCLSSMQEWHCLLLSERWMNSKWWPLYVTPMTGAATLKSEQLSLASSGIMRWDHGLLNTRFWSMCTQSVSKGTELMVHLLLFIVSYVCPAALHGRPQTVYISFSWKQ